MSEANRKKWADALRHGGYIQGTGGLRIADSYCCLGVACDISGLGRWTEQGKYCTASQTKKNCLPYEVRLWLGIKKLCNDVGITLDRQQLLEIYDIKEPIPDSEMLTLITLNDNNVDFNTIANIIENGDIELE